MRTAIATLVSITLGFLTIAEIKAQSDTTKKAMPVIGWSGYVDVFYAYDFNQPKTDYRQTFFYNHNRHNEFNLNFGFIKLSVQHEKYRANIALQAGTYAADNYANEPGLLKNVFEANAGISLNKKNNLWFDAGIFASHIGFESAISLDNYTLTRSIQAENSPYYLSGAKLTYAPNQNVELATLICNGWQHIQKVKGNSLPSFGTQLKLIPIEKMTLNWSTFIGTDDPDTNRRMRYFNNLYVQLQITNKLALISGFDIGIQQRSKGSSEYQYWLSPVFIAHYSFNDHWATAFRAEYYQDKSGVIISTATTNGFNTMGFSLNIDYALANNVACRFEGRWLNSDDNIFVKNSIPTNNNFFITASIAAKFNHAYTNN